MNMNEEKTITSIVNIKYKYKFKKITIYIKRLLHLFILQ